MMNVTGACSSTGRNDHFTFSSKDWVLHNKPPWAMDTSTLEGGCDSGCDSECGSDKENSCYS